MTQFPIYFIPFSIMYSYFECESVFNQEKALVGAFSMIVKTSLMVRCSYTD